MKSKHFVLPSPSSSKMVALPEMKAASVLCQKCVAVIRDWLPIESMEVLSNASTQDRWHTLACQYCFEFFRDYLPNPNVRASEGPEGLHELWQEMCEGMIEIQKHYEWDEIDFDTVRPGLPVNESPLSIRKVVLDRVSKAAESIKAIELTGNIENPSPGKDDSKRAGLGEQVDAVAAAEVCKQVSSLARKYRSIEEIATIPTIDAIETILGYLDQVQLLREQWERVESAGWLYGYTWDMPFKTASTATGSALQQAQSNCYRIAKRLELLGHFPPDEPIGKTMSILLDQPSIDFGSFIEFSIEAIKRHVPTWVVTRIDDERRYILETKARTEVSNELATVEADRKEIERKREIEHERELAANREGSQTSHAEPNNNESLDRQTPATIFAAGDKHRRQSAIEVLRLIRRLIDRLCDETLSDRRWHYSQVDALTEKMMPLWAELGIDQPGMWVDSGSDYGQQTPCKMFQVRDPDLEETQSVMLEHGDGDNSRVFTVRDVGAMLPEILIWKQWLEQKFEIAPVAQTERRDLSLFKTSALGAASRAESVTLGVTAVQSAQSTTKEKNEPSKIRLRMDLLDQYPPTKFKRRTLPDDGKTAYAYLASEKKRNPALWEAESKSFRESTGRDFLWLKGT